MDRKPEAPSVSQSKSTYAKYDNKIYAANAAQLPASSRDSGMSFEAMFGHRGAGGAADRFAGGDRIGARRYDERRNQLARKNARALKKEAQDPFATTSSALNADLAKQQTRLGKAGKSVLQAPKFGRSKGEFSNPTVRF